jgi:Zn-dependent protease
MEMSPELVRSILIGVLILVVSVALHEFGHAAMAHKLGDDTPSRQGRVTLNPLAHADPIGTLLLPLIGGMYGGGGFGWGKPVQWQPHRIRRGINMSTASILVSVAGPFMNLLLATVLVVTHVVLVAQGVLDGRGEGKYFANDMDGILRFAATTNVVLFFFNLLPIPPLDGGHVAESLTPRRHRTAFENFAKFGPFIILGVMLIPQVRQVFLVPATWCIETLYEAFTSIFL